MKVKELDLAQISKKVDPIVEMRNRWDLVTAEVDGVANTLTCAWGAFGNVAEKKTVTVYIRPQRYTKKFMDASGRFTMTFFEGHMEALGFLGSHSGADVPDKIEKAGLHLTHVDGQPTFEEAKYILICKTIYRQPLVAEGFVDPALAQAAFPAKDYSVMYIAEIEKAYEVEA